MHPSSFPSRLPTTEWTKVRITIPILQGVVLLGTVGIKNTAATWTVLPKIVYSSYLPQILQTDSSAGYADGVSAQVTAIVYISLFTTIMLGAAQILSPVGLGEAVDSGRLVNATFAYAPDPSVFRDAKFDRILCALSRSCGGGSKPCPVMGQLCLVEAFDRAPWTFQFHQFAAETSFTKDNMAYKSVTGSYQYIGPLVLEPGYHVREGVIINANDGGLGFRNHTVPLDPPMIDGASWEEDIMWMEPQTTSRSIHVSPQNYVQDGGWFEYEDHTEKYNQPPTNAYGTYRFDERLMDAASTFDQKLREVYNARASQSRIRNISYGDHNSPRTDLMEFWTYGMESMAGYIFIEPDYYDPAFEQAVPVPPSTMRRASHRPTHIHRRQSFFPTDSESSCVQDCMDKNQLATENCFLESCNITTEESAHADATQQALQRPSIHLLCLATTEYPHLPKSTATAWKDHPKRCPGRYRSATGITATIKHIKFVYNATAAEPTPGNTGLPSLIGLTVQSISNIQYDRDEEKSLWAVENPGAGFDLASINLQWGIVDPVTAQKFTDGIRTLCADSFVESRQ
ncbi:hypothetical protein V8F06_014699 [Rhypophila decipiens]